MLCGRVGFSCIGAWEVAASCALPFFAISLFILQYVAKKCNRHSCGSAVRAAFFDWAAPYGTAPDGSVGRWPGPGRQIHGCFSFLDFIEEWDRATGGTAERRRRTAWVAEGTVCHTRREDSWKEQDRGMSAACHMGQQDNPCSHLLGAVALFVSLF